MALKVAPDATVADFDARHPDGADYVIVPAMSRDDDPAVLKWIKSQAGKGAIIIGVCAGAKVVAAAGLLDGKRATTHWYYLDELRKKHPAVSSTQSRPATEGARPTSSPCSSNIRGKRRRNECRPNDAIGAGEAEWIMTRAATWCTPRRS